MHSGSALAFQARGAGSIPAIRSNNISQLRNGGCSQVVRQWIVTPPFAGSNPVIRQFLETVFKIAANRIRTDKTKSRSFLKALWLPISP